MKVARLTVSMPRDLLDALDRELVKDDETRSSVIRRLLEDALREIEEQREIERYVRAYRRRPQTDDEFGWSDRVAAEALSEQTWS